MTDPQMYKSDVYARLRAKLHIDPLELDHQLMEMPQLVQDCGEVVAECINMRDAATTDLKTAESRAADKLRSRHIVVDGKDGPVNKQRSEAQITSEIPSMPEVRKAAETLETVKLDLALWQTLMDSLRTKNASLKTTAELIISGYLTRDSIHSNRREEIRNAASAKRKAV